MSNISIGADIGGSHITTMAIEINTGKILAATRSGMEVNCHGPAEEILASWKKSISETISAAAGRHIAGIGFAMPGPFDYPKGIALFSGVQKFEALFGCDIRHEMSTIPGLPEGVPVRFLNDATCFAIGEAWLGEASGFEKVMAITLGTGFGSAFLSRGVPVENGTEVPEHGWVYHLPYGSTIADDHFSTRWFIRRYQELTGRTSSGAHEIALGCPDDQAARSIFLEFGSNLGHFLAPLIMKFGAGCLVIGGSINKSYGLFREPFLAALEKDGIKNPVVSISAMGEVAAIAGSARLSNNEFYQKVLTSGYKGRA